MKIKDEMFMISGKSQGRSIHDKMVKEENRRMFELVT